MASLLITVQLLLTVLVFFNLNMITMATSPYIEEAKRQNITIGGTVSFACIRHPEQKCTVRWYFVETSTYLSRNKALLQSSAEPGHYSFSGNASNDFTLTIHNVTQSDAGYYQSVCAFRNYTYYYPTPAYLAVFIPPAPPICHITAMDKSLYVGQRVNFHCSAVGGKPAADLQWVRGKNDALTTGLVKTPISTSIYQTYMRPQDFGQVFTCIASSPALEKPQNCTIGPLYPTSIVHIDVIQEIGAPEVQPLSFGCSANISELGDQIPTSVLNYSWYINDYQVEFGNDGITSEGDKQFMMLNQTSHLPRNTQISCEAFGPHGSLGNASVVINEEQEDQNKHYRELPRPTLIIKGQKTKKKYDIRPIIFINAGALMLLAFLVFLVICIPKKCRCSKKNNDLPFAAAIHVMRTCNLHGQTSVRALY
ncbi:uncharacterized protein [Amphiura filiformis]|uniref:uncharacterized protein n=1 Tax=Amphiura filiformis TaxID=82378 RepID=UPI003B21F594